MKPRIVDLCSGIGGMTLGFTQGSWDCVFACDSDEAACDTFEANHGFRPAGDLAGIDPEAVPDHEVCVAGLPCVGFSTAGLRRGFDDSREHVLHGILRILAVKRPAAVVIENVVGLVQHERGRSLRFVRECLRGLGYRVSWSLLDATEFGGAQHRRRVFIVGSRDPRFDFGRLERRPRGRIRDVLEPDIRHGWLDPAEYRLLDNPKVSRSGLIFAGYRAGKPLWFPGGRLDQSRTHRHMNRIYAAEGVAPTITSQEMSGRYWVVLGGRVRRLTRLEVQRLQGFPDDFRWPAPTRFYAQLGNSVHRGTVEALARAIKVQLLSGRRVQPAS